MKIYSITGCSSSGKNTVLDNLLIKNKKIIPIISVTSRPKRCGETEKDYKFVTYDEAKNMLNNNEFIENRIYTVINEDGQEEQWIYGITKDSIDLNSNNTYIVIVDYKGREELRNYLKKNNKENSMVTLYLEVDYKTRIMRYLNRDNMTDNKVLECLRRFQDDNKNVLPAKEDSDYVVSNMGNVDNVVNRILDIIKNYGIDGTGEFQVYVCQNEECKCEAEFIRRE